jgi:hypothetical protein
VQGVQGVPGIQGVPGPVTTSAPAGSTQLGTFALQGNATAAGQYVAQSSISFPLQLASAPAVIEIQRFATPTTDCPGSSSAPAAAPGYLCLYFDYAQNIYAAAPPYDLYPQDPTNLDFGASTYGALLGADSAASGEVQAAGSWAVTAQ